MKEVAVLFLIILLLGYFLLHLCNHDMQPRMTQATPILFFASYLRKARKKKVGSGSMEYPDRWLVGGGNV